MPTNHTMSAAHNNPQHFYERLWNFLDHASDAFFLHNQFGAVLDINRRACELFGYRHKELIGMTLFDFGPTSNPMDWGRKYANCWTGSIRRQ